MANIYQSTNIVVASGRAVTLVTDDIFTLAENVSVASNETNASLGQGIYASGIAKASVFGTVYGTQGIRFDEGGTILVGSTGRVVGDFDGIANEISGNLRVLNYGEILCTRIGGQGVHLFRGSSLEVVNHGNIFGGDGGVLLSAGFLTLTNFGTISATTNSVIASILADTVINRGILDGDVLVSAGADLYDGRGGTVIGSVLGGAGNDTLYGGLGADSLFGEDDADTIYFDAEDLIYGTVSAGTGYDTGYYTDNTTPITINLTTQGFEAYYGSAADELVFSGSLGGFGAFARFGAGNDTYDGSVQADNVDGGTGIDVLYGRGGDDVLAGGFGGDWLSGGAGADTFDYNALTDSTASISDYIADFSTAQGDKIDLSTITFGAATFNTGYGVGTSVYTFAGGGGTTLVQVYNLTSLDMQIVVNQASLAAGDFVL